MGKIIKLATALAKSVEEALQQNNYYCPCRLEQNENTKCMCQAFKEQNEGICHCGLFQKVKGENE